MDGNLGVSLIQNVPYANINLPLEKIFILCREIIQSTDKSIKEIEKQFHEDLLRAALEAAKFVRMSDLKSEFDDLNEKLDDENENSTIMEIEQTFPAEETSSQSSARTSDDEDWE